MLWIKNATTGGSCNVILNCVMNSLWNMSKSHNKMRKSVSEVHNNPKSSVMESIMKCVEKL